MSFDKRQNGVRDRAFTQKSLSTHRSYENNRSCIGGPCNVVVVADEVNPSDDHSQRESHRNRMKFSPFGHPAGVLWTLLCHDRLFSPPVHDQKPQHPMFFKDSSRWSSLLGTLYPFDLSTNESAPVWHFPRSRLFLTEGSSRRTLRMINLCPPSA